VVPGDRLLTHETSRSSGDRFQNAVVSDLLECSKTLITKAKMSLAPMPCVPSVPNWLKTIAK
jgi:hypothetical protein